MTLYLQLMLCYTCHYYYEEQQTNYVFTSLLCSRGCHQEPQGAGAFKLAIIWIGMIKDNSNNYFKTSIADLHTYRQTSIGKKGNNAN